MFRTKDSSPRLAIAQIRAQNTEVNFHNLFFRNLWTRTLPAVAITGVLSIVSTTSPGRLRAQEPNPTSQPAATSSATLNPITEQDGIYIYRVKVVERNLDCVSYLNRSGSSRLDFEGTALLRGAKGEAKVTSERGKIVVDAHFEGLTPANGFGKEYLTYVLWAISPDGRAQNLGEVLPAGTKNNLKVTTALQSFGLIVTAEPYFSVTQPSDVVVLQNIIRPDKTNGVMEKVEANYSLLPRGMYAETAGSQTIANPITRNERSPLEMYEADNAIRIAQNAGATQYAPKIMAEALLDDQNAGAIDGNKHGDRKMEITEAREAVQHAEDARIASLRKQAAERAQAQVTAKDVAQNNAAQSQIVAANAQADTQTALAAKAQADAARSQAEAKTAAAQATAASASKSAEEMREKLRTQLNAVLATSETARGLIVNMSDVLFDTNKYTLKSGTQVSLAKVAGILEAYPGLKVQVEGYTDSTGSDQLNQKLSENRALAVKDFLVAQGESQGSVSSEGFGKNDPVADNGTAHGRSENRRVNLVVSGEAIGIAESASLSPSPLGR
jgi:outer membrane protein OmpA-like peptidoglycan-associated protein